MGEEASGLTRVVAIFGFRRGVAVVNVAVDGQELSTSGEGVQLISNPARRGYEMWWCANLEVPNGSNIKLTVKVGIKGVGPDRERSSENTYLVDSESPSHEVRVKKIGWRNFPLLKGPLKIIVEQTEQDLIDSQVEGMLEDTET